MSKILKSFSFVLVVVAVTMFGVTSVANATTIVASHFGDADPTGEATPWTKVDGVGGSAGAATFDGEAVWQVTDGPGSAGWGPNYTRTLVTADFNSPWELTARWGGGVVDDAGGIILRDASHMIQLICQIDNGTHRFIQDRGTAWQIPGGGDLDTLNHLFTVKIWSSPSDADYHFQVNAGVITARAKSLFGVDSGASLVFGGNGGGYTGFDTGYYQQVNFANQVPEPSALALLAAGLLGLLAYAWRKRK